MEKENKLRKEIKDIIKENVYATVTHDVAFDETCIDKLIEASRLYHQKDSVELSNDEINDLAVNYASKMYDVSDTDEEALWENRRSNFLEGYMTASLNQKAEQNDAVEFAKFCMANASVYPNSRKTDKYSINDDSLQAGWSYKELYEEFKILPQPPNQLKK